MIWVDALDNPFAEMFGTMFRENYFKDEQAVSLPAGDTAARYGAGLMPVEIKSPRLASPLLAYPYDRTRETLDQLALAGQMHPAHGVKMRYANPATGGHVFPTIAVFIQWMPAQFSGQTYRSTESVIFCAVEGGGRIHAGDTEFSFGPHDIFTAPSWTPYRISTDSECVLFSYSDRAPQETLGLWREEDPSNSAPR